MKKFDYNKVAQEYAQHRQVHPRVLESLCGAAWSTSRVLEVGCGTGNYITAISSVVDCPCWGIDPSDQMLRQAKARAFTIHFSLGKAESLDFPPSFDLIFSVDVIHHVADRAAYFHQAYKALKPGGKICTATDSEWILRHRQPLAYYFPETIEIELTRYSRITKLRKMMLNAGFDNINESMVEWQYQLDDIQAYQDKSFSILHLISEKAFRQGIEHIKQDLQAGPISGVSRYVLLWGVK